MNEPPIARHFIACENVIANPAALRYSLQDLAFLVHPPVGGRYPLLDPELCFFALLTNGRGVHDFAVEQRRGVGPAVQFIWRSRTGKIDLGNDPTALFGLPLRFRNVVFPLPGQYEFVLLCDGIELASELIEARV
jgi:hypothetical protein